MSRPDQVAYSGANKTNEISSVKLVMEI